MAKKTEITQVPIKQCNICNIGRLIEYSEDFYRCDWCASAVPKK